MLVTLSCLAATRPAVPQAVPRAAATRLKQAASEQRPPASPCRSPVAGLEQNLGRVVLQGPSRHELADRAGCSDILPGGRRLAGASGGGLVFHEISIGRLCMRGGYRQIYIKQQTDSKPQALNNNDGWTRLVMFSGLRSASLSASGPADGAAVLLPGGAGHAAGHSAAGTHPGGTRPPEGLMCACVPFAQQNVPCQRLMPHIRRESRSAESLPFFQGSVLASRGLDCRLTL